MLFLGEILITLGSLALGAVIGMLIPVRPMRLPEPPAQKDEQ